VPNGKTLRPFSRPFIGIRDNYIDQGAIPGVAGTYDGTSSVQLTSHPNLCTWSAHGTGVQVRLAYARLTSDEATRLLEFYANKSIGLPTQNLISAQTTSAITGATSVNFSIDQPNIDMIGFTFPFSDTAIDWCPNPYLNNLSFQAQGRQLGGMTWDSTKPNLLQQTGSALTEPQTQGLNDELLSSYADP
jgi:hypothetical protein